MNTPDLTILLVALVGGCALSGVLAVATWLLRFRRHICRLETRLTEVEAAVAALSAGALAGSRADAELRACIARLAPRVENLDHRVPSVQSFQRAIEMAQQNADADTLMRCCGLNRGEADLVISMHGRRSRAA